MGDFGPVVIAVITTLGTIMVAYIGAQKSGKLPISKVPDMAELRDQIEYWKAKSEDWKTHYEMEKEEHGRTRSRAEFAEREADSCDRRLSAVYAELAARGFLVDRRNESRIEALPSDAPAD